MDDRDVFVFPVLKAAEIAGHLQRLLQEEKISITREDIVKPVPEKIQAIMRAIVSVVYDRKYLYVAQQQGCDGDYHFDTSGELSYAVVLVNTTCIIRRLLCRLGMQDFTVADLIRPQTKRMIQVFSAFTNFLSFRHGRLPFFTSSCYERESRVHELQRLREENRREQQRIQFLRQEAASRAVVTQQLQNQIAEKSAEIDTAKKNMLEVENRVYKLKMEMAMTRSSMEEIKTTILTIREKCSQLQQKIFPSREHFSKELGELVEEAKTLQEVKDHKNRQIGDLGAMAEYLCALDKSVDDNFVLLSRLETLVAEESHQRELLQQSRESLDNVRQSIQDATRREAALVAACNDVVDRIKQLHLQHKRKVVAIESAIKDAQSERDSAVRSTDVDSEYRALLQEQRDLQVELSAEHQRHERFMAQVANTQKDLLAALDAYHDEMEEAALGAVKSMQALASGIDERKSQRACDTRPAAPH